MKTAPLLAPTPVRYWVGVASKEHVARGVAGGFCQLGHGKSAPLKRMAAGDWIAYYSSKVSLDSGAPCQQFTALGQLVDDEVYAFEMAPGFVPYRRNVAFEQSAQSASILPMVAQLSFIKDPKRWGYPFRFGHFEMSRTDFEVIAQALLGRVPE
jgi:EVE domain